MGKVFVFRWFGFCLVGCDILQGGFGAVGFFAFKRYFVRPEYSAQFGGRILFFRCGYWCRGGSFRGYRDSLEFCRVWINVLVRQSRLDSLFLLSGVKEESVIELFLNLRIEDSFQGGGGASGAWLRQKQIRLESLWV